MENSILNTEKNHVKETFKNNDSHSNFCLIKYFKEFDIARWIAFVGLFLFLTSFAFTINDFINYAKNAPDKIWYGIIDRFTNQSNWLLFIFTFFFVFYPNHQILRGNGFLIATMVYITFTFFGYNVILVGFGGYGYTGKGMDLAGNIWLHVICPVYFIVFGILTMLFRKNEEPPKVFWKTLLLGMIYPTIYVIYLSTIPFVYTAYQGDDNDPLTKFTYSVYGGATNTKDNPLSWAYICGMYFVFFPGVYAIYYYSWKGFNKLNKRN